MMQYFTASDGAKIAYRQRGTGPTVLCLAGLTRNSSDFDYVWPHLTDVNAVAMDYRGRGDSDWSGPASYTIPREAQDEVELLDHLHVGKAAILGTSRGGLIAMTLALMAKDRLAGVMMNDIGPVIEPAGLNDIRTYVGRNPPFRNFAESEAALATRLPGFGAVPDGRWAAEARKHYRETPNGLEINYDPALRDAVLATFDAPPVDLWPFFDALSGIPVAALRGENSNLLSRATFAEMQRRRPDMIAAEVPGRGHVPFLDEPVSLDVLARFLEAVT